MFRFLFATCFLFLLLAGNLYGQTNKEKSERFLYNNHADTVQISKFLKIGTSYLLKPGETKEDLDKALHFANAALQLSDKLKDARWQGRSWLLVSNSYREKGENAQAERSLKTAIEFFQTCACYSELGDSYFSLAMMYDASSVTGYQAVILIYQQALHYYKQAGDKLKQANTLKEIGDIRQVLGDDLPLAMAELKEALSIYKSVGHVRLQSVYDLIGYVYTEMSDYDHAIQYSLAAIKTAEQLMDSSSQMSTIYNRHGLVLFHLQRFDSSLAYMRKAISVAVNNRDTFSVITIKLNVVDIYLQLGRSRDALKMLEEIRAYYPIAYESSRMLALYVAAYLSTKQYGKAQPLVAELIAIYKELDEENYERFNLLSALINYTLDTRQYVKVQKYCSEYIDLSRRVGNLKLRSEGYLWLFKADSSLGNYKSAITNYQVYIAARDSIYNENKARQIAQLEIQYETDKKEQRIELLTEQELRQKAQLERVETTRNVIIGGTGMLMLILGLGYNRYRLKQRSNRQLEAKQLEIYHKNETLRKLLDEKEWLIKEIHHRVKNNLQIVMSLLHTQTQYLDNEAAVTAIDESRSRMHAMALIHQKLYQSDMVSSVDMQTYIRELVDFLQESIDAGMRVRVDCKVEPIELDVVQAIPVGLILNEAVTNSIKYAYPGNGAGNIEVSMVRKNNNCISMAIGDDGIGLPKEVDLTKTESLGMSLMNGLVRQLDGSIRFRNGKGLKIEIEFPFVSSKGQTELMQ